MILDRFKPGGKVALETGADSVLGRVDEPEDIQGACFFLAPDASSGITGANIFEVGGGGL